MSAFYLGVDGGQSSTIALIADQTGRIVGRGVGGPCNHAGAAEGRQKFRNAVTACLKQACEEAGLDLPTVNFAAACFGFSGGAEDKAPYVHELIRSARYKITHDAEIALSGATAGQPGIIVIAGTGSIAFGRNAANGTARAGGWGYIFGDEGGAFDIVRRALRAALRFEEGRGRQTVLRERLLSSTGSPTANDLLHRFYTDEYPRHRIAQLAPLITEAALDDDESAIDIIRFAARQLADLAEGVHHKLFESRQSVPVCYIGGVFRSHLIRSDFAVSVRASLACEAGAPRYSPAAGATLEALRLAGNQSILRDVPESEK